MTNRHLCIKRIHGKRQRDSKESRNNRSLLLFLCDVARVFLVMQFNVASSSLVKEKNCTRKSLRYTVKDHQIKWLLDVCSDRSHQLRGHTLDVRYSESSVYCLHPWFGLLFVAWCSYYNRNCLILYSILSINYCSICEGHFQRIAPWNLWVWYSARIWTHDLLVRRIMP